MHCLIQPAYRCSLRRLFCATGIFHLAEISLQDLLPEPVVSKFKQDLDARQGRREARAAEELRRAEEDTLRMLELEAAGKGPSADELMVYLFALNSYTTAPCMTAQLVYYQILLCLQTCSQTLNPNQTCFEYLLGDWKDLH